MTALLIRYGLLGCLSTLCGLSACCSLATGAFFADTDDLDLIAEIVIHHQNLDKFIAAIIETELIIGEVSLDPHHSAVSSQHGIVLLKKILSNVSNVDILGDGLHAQSNKRRRIEAEVGTVVESELFGLKGLSDNELVVEIFASE